MSQFLEASMLICFGISWPINVYKNIKGRTAKSMSMPFILLILTGYILGITAKLITHNISYVLLVYVLNLVIVSVNVFVYFRNKHYDKIKKESESENEMNNDLTVKRHEPLSDPMIIKQVERYKASNMSSGSDDIVVLGTDSFNGINFNEMAQNNDIDEKIYNRSIFGLRMEFAAEAVDEVLSGLSPSKIFLNFGETDIRDRGFDIDTFIENYRWILYTLHRISGVKLYIVSVFSDAQITDRLNDRLQKLSDETGCIFIDIKYPKSQDCFDREVFHGIRTYIRSHPITFADAIQA